MGWVRVCVCVCVCLHQTVPVTSGLADTQPLSLQPRFLHPPFCESHRWERQERKNNRGERQFWGLQISDCPEFSPCLLLCLHSCRTFFCPSMIVYMCVSLSLLLSLSVSVSLFHSLNSELQEHRDFVQFDQCPLSLPVSRIPLSFWQAPFVFTKYANDCVCVHLSWPGSGFPPLSVSPL